MRVQYDVMVQEFTRVLKKRDSIMRMQKMQQLFLHRIALQVCSHMA